MNELLIFNNPEFGKMRTLMIDGNPWAVGKDVATALEYKNTKDALAKHVDVEDKQILQRSQVTTFAIPPRGLTIINESGLYSLIFSSKLPGAKRFKHWVTSEVLPTLRKTGTYTMPGAEVQPESEGICQRPLTADDYLTAARILAGCRNERLPLVLPLIKKAGLEFPMEMAMSTVMKTANSKDPETAKLLRVALDDYKLSIRQLEKLTGIHSVQLYRMKNGTSRYNAVRAQIVREVIQRLLPDLDIDELLKKTE